jgi:hypothetical protein
VSALPKVNLALYEGVACPYCRQRDLRWYRSYERKGMVYVICAICGSSGPFLESEEKALAAWAHVARLAQPLSVNEAEQILDGLSTPNFLRLVALVADRLKEPHG